MIERDKMKTYWTNGVNAFEMQMHSGPDDKHDWWKWREFLKMSKILDAEIKSIIRLGGYQYDC